MASNRRTLTPAFIRNVKPAPEGKRVDYWDVPVPGFALRVTDTGAKSLTLTARFPSNPKHPTRRRIGDAATMPLGDGRQIARDWLEMIGNGIDPQQEIAGRQQAAAEGPLTFGQTFERWKTEALDKQRRGKDVEGNFRRELLPRWKDRPLVSIVRRDVRDATMAVFQRGHAAMAGSLLKQCVTFFNWCCEAVDLENNPAATIKGAKLFGPRPKRDRTPTDAEIAAIWQATESLAYPAREFFRFAIFSGQRRSQIARMRWRQLDLDAGTWTCPASIMKMSLEFVLPLTPQMVALLKSLPRFGANNPDNDHVFSATLGEKPLGNSVDKVRKEIAAQLTDVPRWVLHDFRRSMRSTMSRMRVDHDAAEACLSHGKTGVHGTYDTHELIDEKRKAMAMWNDHVDKITAPTANVVPMRAA